ncbi:MAG: dihydrolipoamide acetyltransferase family protein [Candidatus Dormibacteraceae bacterium]
MTTITFVMPQLGESVYEGTLSRWLVKPGDRLIEFEPMLEVDTDKVSAQVPAPVTGVLRQILVQEGETVQVGAEIAVIEVDAEVTARAEPKQTEPQSHVSVPPPDDPNLQTPEHDGNSSPAALILARDRGVDVSKVSGTGLGGRVTRKDIQRLIDDEQARSSTSPPPSKLLDTDHSKPLSRVRRLIAQNMTLSKATIPHAWQTQEVDMSGVVANRRANIERFKEREGYSLTHLPYVIKATASSLREHPDVNATFNGTELIVHDIINIGVSVGLDDTLVVPVVGNADELTVADIARTVAELALRAREKTLKADDLQGGTFTVNNSGTFGTLLSYSVIVPGQAGILTMEAIVERPVAAQGIVDVKPMMYLCFSLDHRVLDGLQAARFLTSCRRWLEAVTVDTPIW